MKKILLIAMLILFVPSTVLAAPLEQASAFANVTVFVNSRQINLTEQPILVNNIILLPLREIAESLGVIVEWKQNPDQVILEKGNKKLAISLDSKKVHMDRQIFFMEQIPVIINGHTMVSLRFITEVLGADLVWDEKNRKISMTDNGKFAELPQADTVVDTDNYYKLYGVLIGPGGGPGYEEAKNYVIKEGLLIDVRDIQIVDFGLSAGGGNSTLVSGVDENNQEKLFWLNQDSYIGEISIAGTALIPGISKETVISILQTRGIDEASIKEIYIRPYNDQTIWFVMADQGGKRYCYYLDFNTGDIVVENVFKIE